jgi:hypothetical protein
MPKRFHFKPYVDRLKDLPFTTAVEFKEEPRAGIETRADGTLEIRTARGTYKFAVEAKGTRLDHTLINAVIIQKHALDRPKTGFILFAPYIPQATGELLIREKVNFVDDAGNIHLVLDDAYYVTKLGLKPPVAPPRAVIGAAAAQVEFVLLAEPEAVRWPIRTLAEAAAVGKTYAANVRKGLEAARLIGKNGILDRKRLEERFLTAYADVLRPNLLIGTYRAAQKDPGEFIEAMGNTFTRKDIRWALTGAAGENELERYYRGETTTVFVTDLPKEVQHELRLVPDPRGPVTLLRTFGTRVVWRPEPRPLAHPFLIYAELLYQGGQRDLDAAELIKEQYLAA